MLLYLLRHGVAIDREDPECPDDAERWLTPEGIEKTRGVAAGLRKLGIHPGVILSSPLRRAVETAEIAAKELGHAKGKIRRTESMLPDADPAALLKEVVQMRKEEILCAGHAPHLDEMIAHIVGMRVSFTALKKAGAACLEINSLAASRGKLLWLFPPKALRQLGE